MSTGSKAPSSAPREQGAPSPGRTLRRLFLTLFLRGRTSRGLQKSSAPKSVGSKLALTLVFYALFGFLAVAFAQQRLFAFSLFLHAMTFAFVGMFVASSAGEVLFNKEEADILLHRPVKSRALLWAKVGMLVEVSLWLTGAFNLVGLFTGIFVVDGGWLFPVAHVLSGSMQALFCTGLVVLVYQLCLRCFGRERLEGLMTSVQVLVAVGMVVASQLVPQFIGRFGARTSFGLDSWWVVLFPPAWFAGFDDAITGHGSPTSWTLGVLGVLATGTVLGLAFGRLARDYQTGLQTLSETGAIRRPHAVSRRWMQMLVKVPPLSWWLRDPVSRASFLLTAAYLMRDRDVKLRIYPSLAPMLVMPIIFLVQDRSGHGSGGFGTAVAAGYVGIVPMLALNLLQYSQQWQAADLFRLAPIKGPAALCHGGRRAVLCLLALPTLILFAVIAWVLRREASFLPLIVPGLIALPVYAMVPCVRGQAVPLSVPIEEAKSAGRGLSMILVIMISIALSGVAIWAWSGKWFGWMLLGETIVAVSVYVAMRRSLSRAVWPALE